MISVPNYRFKLIRTGLKPAHVKCSNSESAAKVIRHVCCEEDPTTEKMVVLFLDGLNNLRGSTIVAQGGAHGLAITAREIYFAACRGSAAGIILGHNHPSGSVVPSAEDIAMTRAVIDAGRVIGIPLLDHIIVNDSGDHYSIFEDI